MSFKQKSISNIVVGFFFVCLPLLRFVALYSCNDNNVKFSSIKYTLRVPVLHPASRGQTRALKAAKILKGKPRGRLSVGPE